MSSVNKDLIYHLYSIFKPYVKTEPKIYNRKLNKLTKDLPAPAFLAELGNKGY